MHYRDACTEHDAGGVRVGEVFERADFVFRSHQNGTIRLYLAASNALCSASGEQGGTTAMGIGAKSFTNSRNWPYRTNLSLTSSGGFMGFCWLEFMVYFSRGAASSV